MWRNRKKKEIKGYNIREILFKVWREQNEKKQEKKKTRPLSFFVALFFKLETQPYIEKQLYTFGMLQLQNIF